MASDGLKSMAEAFLDPEIRVISFDVFDTLLLRPVRTEAEKFGLLEKDFRKITDAHISFVRLRTMAEATLRRRILRHELQREDVTIDEIYEVMEKEFGLAPSAAAGLAQKEMELERRLCHARKAGRYLFDQALRSGRRVILLSDMYLRSGQLRELLAGNGFPFVKEGSEICGQEGRMIPDGNSDREPIPVYVSSETGLRKSTGSMFRKLPEILGVEPSQILHIGDSMQSDILPARENGIKALWLPGTMETFEAKGCGHAAEKLCRDLTDWEKARKEPGISIMRRMAANRYFDDPFRDFDPESDYNGDPWFVGYAALGPEVLSLLRWLVDNAARDGVSRILFLSRDGYLPMEAYRIWKEYQPGLPEYGYLYTSRLALLPVMIRHPLDLYDLPVDVTRHTPRRLIHILSFCCHEESSLQRMTGSGEVRQPDEAFTAESFQQFIGGFIRLCYDPCLHEKSRERITDYLLHNKTAPVTKETAIFDMGYSGRIAQAIREACSIPVPVCFFHGDGARQFLCEGQGDFRIRTFFDFSPYMEGTMREYAYLETAPSCVGYTQDLEPVFDCGPAEHYGDSARAMQKGALDLVRDYLKWFSDCGHETSFRNHNGAMAFEAFLRHCAKGDEKIYEKVLIDDELWGGRRNISLLDLMHARQAKLPDFAR